MSRIKSFFAQIEVTPEIQRDAVAKALVMDRLQEIADADLRGPRGGRYERVSELRISSGITDDDFMRGTRTMTYIARFDGRYVRPKRA